jgi:hypothetical protein
MWLSVCWFLPCFEMSCCGGPHFSCCGWRVGVACDRWWLFSLLWLLCLGHMCFDLLYCLSGLCLSCGVSKLNWWNPVFSTSGGVGVFSWIWRLVWFALVQGEYGLLHWETLCFSCYPLEFETWCLPSTLLDSRRSLWFALVWGKLVIYHVYCIFCISLTFSSYSPKSLCFTCYTSLYLLNYAYHCARMSSNEMWTLLLDHAR